MAYIEGRKRKNGSVTYYVRWIDPDTRQGVAQKMPSKDGAELLLSVVKAHANDIDAALESVAAHYRGIYTVSRMIEDHVSLLTVGGYTIRRYRGMLGCHIADGLSTMDAAKVENRDIVAWVKSMQAKGLAPKTTKNVHGLISASYELSQTNWGQAVGLFDRHRGPSASRQSSTCRSKPRRSPSTTDTPSSSGPPSRKRYSVWSGAPLSWAEFSQPVTYDWTGPKLVQHGTLLHDGDPDMNCLFRWDWRAMHLEFPEDYPDGAEEHYLDLFFMMQGRPYNQSVRIKVTPADEPAVRAWPAGRAETMRAMWQPFLG